jgi:multiple sugar transport system ATP-binding protein
MACGAVVWSSAAMDRAVPYPRKYKKLPGPLNMAKVILQNIKKIYDKDVIAVHDFNLEITDKEFVVLVGPSGCGKSTTLRMIAGLEEISSGELYIDGKLVNSVQPKDRDIAMVFQNYALYPHMSVYENMAFALKLRKRSKEFIDKKVCETAEILGITELLKRKPKALSGGQRQRVAIGRAIVREPRVFLMDEPLSNLDAKLRNQMRAEIIKLRQRINTTFVYVTHDQTEAMTLGDRIVIMKDGFIQQIGTPQEVFHKPNNLFVAGFIGTPQMNRFDARLVRKGRDYMVQVCGIEITLPKESCQLLCDKDQQSADIIVGIRPEHIHVVPLGTENAITLPLDVSEMLGSEVHMHFSLKNSAADPEEERQDIIIRMATTSLSENLYKGADVLAEISFVLPSELIHIFERGSGVNLLA